MREIIQYNGNDLVWRYPTNVMKQDAKIIVNPTQNAILYINGKPSFTFGVGEHELDLDTDSKIRSFLDVMPGKNSNLECNIYFVAINEQLSLPWGTDTKVQFIEPFLKFPLEVGAGGELSLTVKNPLKFLLKFVGNKSSISNEQLIRYIRSIIVIYVKPFIAKIFKEKQISIFEIDEYLPEFSYALKQMLQKELDDYGVELNKFMVTRIVKPDGDSRYEKAKDLYFRKYADIADAKIRHDVDLIDQNTLAEKMKIEAMGKAKKRDIEGYTYQEERTFDVAEKGAVDILNEINQKYDNSHADFPRFCDNCGAALKPGMIYCDNCGSLVRNIDRCPNCGYVFERPGNFCPMCGTKRNNVKMGDVK